MNALSIAERITALEERSKHADTEAKTTAEAVKELSRKIDRMLLGVIGLLATAAGQLLLALLKH